MTCKFAIGLSFELVDFTNGASFLDQLESVLKRDKKPSRTTFNWKFYVSSTLLLLSSVVSVKSIVHD